MHALCINFHVQVVMLVTSVKQADIFLHAYMSTYHRTDLHMYEHIYRIQSLVVPPCLADCFTVLDSAATTYQVKLKESMYIKWEKPDLNQQVKHLTKLNLQLTLSPGLAGLKCSYPVQPPSQNSYCSVISSGSFFYLHQLHVVCNM